MGLEILPLDAQTAATPLLVPIVHKDPFDELLLVQAQQSGARGCSRVTAPCSAIRWPISRNKAQPL